MEKREERVLCRHMTSYGECTLTEEPCVQGPCSREEPEEWVRVVRCRDCAKRGETEFGARYCREPMGMIGQIPVAEDFFCGGGEPRGNAR